MKRAGGNPDTSPHWLRHAHASHAIDNGAPITLVSQTLGHADLKTTSVYAHARPNEQLEPLSQIAVGLSSDTPRLLIAFRSNFVAGDGQTRDWP